MADIHPTEADYLPLRIVGDQLQIGAVAWDIRHRRQAGGVLRAEVRHAATGGEWGELTAILSPLPDGHAGTLTLDTAPWLVRRWVKVDGIVRAEAGPVSDDEFDAFTGSIGRRIRAG